MDVQSRWPSAIDSADSHAKLSVFSTLLMLLALALLAGCGLELNRNGSDEPLIRIQIESSNLMRLSALASGGNDAAFGELTASDAAIAASCAELKTQKTPQALQWNSSNNWEATHQAVSTLLAARTRFERDAEIQADLADAAPLIQARLVELARTLSVSKSSDPKRIFFLMRTAFVLERIPNRMSRLLAGGADATAAADSLARDTTHLKSNLHAYRHGNPDLEIDAETDASAQQELDAAIALAESQYDAVGEMLDNVPARLEAFDAAEAIALEAERLADTATRARLIR